MFNLEQAIADWRREMLRGGVQAPEVLDEVESHLRDEIEQQMRSGRAARDAFNEGVQQVGRADSLQVEFAKISGHKTRKLTRALYTLAGIPNQYVSPDMNTPIYSTKLEPRWATYLKATVFIAPALLLWAFASIMAFPKLNWMCQQVGARMPYIYDIAQFFIRYLFYFIPVSFVMLGLLEWRMAAWPRYRKATLGVGVFILNSLILTLITIMVVLAIIAAPALLHHAK